jgi:RHO1 GDP-GTP exchange protein 1/2
LTDPFYKPIPLDLLILEDFTDLPTQRGTGLLRGFGGGNRNDAQANTPGMSPESATDSRVVYPCTILHTGRLGGLYTVYTESAQARSKWKDKLQEAIGLRKVVQESNKVFEVETLSSDALVVGPRAWMGKINCSVPFSKQIVLSRIVVGEF